MFRHTNSSANRVRWPLTTLVWLGALVALVACGDALFPAAPNAETVLDGPIDGLTLAQTREHAVGDGLFATSFTPSTGLGPTFVSASCESCHVGDGKGHPVFDLVRFGRMTGTGFDPMLLDGGPQLQNRAVGGHAPEVPAKPVV